MNSSKTIGSQSSGIFSKLYGLTMYIISQVAILVWALFLCNIGFFKIDEGKVGDERHILLINLGLVLLFVVQHMIMARKGFKSQLTKLLPSHLIRSTFVGAAGLSLLAITIFWQPMPKLFYQLHGLGRIAIWVLYCIGWILVVVSTKLIDDKALHGIKQSFSGNASEDSVNLMTPSLYKIVRHPMMLGFIIVLWASPDMTHGRLFMAIVMTLYILIGIRYEERALIRKFGEEYKRYKKHVPAIIPSPFKLKYGDLKKSSSKTSDENAD